MVSLRLAGVLFAAAVLSFGQVYRLDSAITFGAGVVAAGRDGAYVSGTDGVVRFAAAGASRVAGVEPRVRLLQKGRRTVRQAPAPHAIAVDTNGNLYVADPEANVVRRVSPGGLVTVVAGTGTRGYAGDGGPATGAQLDDPTGLATDARGNIFIAEGTLAGNARIRRIDAQTGTISTFAGDGVSGFAGDGGPAARARFASVGRYSLVIFSSSAFASFLLLS